MAKLVVSFPAGSETSHDLSDDHITVGRLPDNVIQIEDASVSSHHAELVRRDGGYTVRDLDSTNGTRVNGETVTEQPLQEGDRVQFGKIGATFRAEAGAESMPLPEESRAESKPTESSARPSDFANASPFRSKGKKKDSTGRAIIGLSILAMCAFAGAVAMILTLQPG